MYELKGASKLHWYDRLTAICHTGWEGTLDPLLNTTSSLFSDNVGKDPLTASPRRSALKAQLHGTSNSNNTVGGGRRSDNGEAWRPPSSPPRKRSQRNQRNQLTRAVSEVGAGLLVADTALLLLLAPSVAHVSASQVPPGEQPMRD